MKHHLLFACALLGCMACKKDKDVRTVLVGGYCDSCMVNINADGDVRDELLVVDTAQRSWTTGSALIHEYRIESGGSVTVSGRPLRMNTDTATSVWIKVDGTPSGFEFALPDTTVRLSITVP